MLPDRGRESFREIAETDSKVARVTFSRVAGLGNDGWHWNAPSHRQTRTPVVLAPDSGRLVSIGDFEQSDPMGRRCCG